MLKPPADHRYGSRSLPPYSYVPGHELPNPVTDPRGHLHGQAASAPVPPETLARLPTEPVARRRDCAAILATNAEWRYALDLFNAGFYWEAHEAWDKFWHSLGRTSPEARFVQGLIRLAAACVKIREGRPEGVARHAARARELLGEPVAAERGGAASHTSDALGLDSGSLSAVLRELERYRPECWHTSRAPVVRVVSAEVRLAG